MAQDEGRDVGKVAGAVWRKRMQDLSRNVGRPHAPLFAPLALAASAQIESVPVAEMVSDANRLRRNASELRHILGLDAVVCAVPSALEWEASGATVSEHWPPRLLRVPPGAPGELDSVVIAASPRLAASLDAVRQLSAADASDPVLVAALTGPATLMAQWRLAASVAGDEVDAEAGYDHIGRLLATLARLYAEAGVHVLQWHESHRPAEPELDAWKAALGTAGNVARFHRIPPLLVFGGSQPASAWPPQAVPCPTRAQQASAPPRAHGRAWVGDPESWPLFPGETAPERYITTVIDLPSDFGIATLKARVEQSRRGP